jgi:hypothetical protein
MTIRSLVAIVFAVCSIASVFVPAEASARSGGLTINRGPVARSFAPRPAFQSSVHIPQGRALVTKGAAVSSIHATHVAPVRRFSRIFGHRHLRNGIVVYYWPGYSAGDFIGIAEPYPTDVDVPLLPQDGVATTGRRCGPQEFVVPSEAGGERTVIVTRCRSE